MGTIYPGYRITRLRGEAIGILVIAATLDLRKSGDENAELEFWQPPIRRMQEDHERVERVRQSRLKLPRTSVLYRGLLYCNV